MHGPQPPAPAPSTLKDHTKFHFLLGQVFCSKQKDQILPATIEKKNKFYLLKKSGSYFFAL